MKAIPLMPVPVPLPHLVVEALALGNDSGLGRHVRLLVDALPALSKEWRVTLLLPRNVHPLPPPGMALRYVRPWAMRAWIELRLPWILARLNPDAVLHTGYTLPRLSRPGPSLLLVPDAGPLEPAGLRMSLHAERNARAMRRQIPRASRLLVSTDFTARRLQSLLSVQSGSIFHLPPYGAYTSAWSQPTSDDEVIARRYPQGFFLSVGNIEPRKNHIGLLKGYAYMRRWAEGEGLNGKALPSLVLIGHEAWDNGAARQTAEALGLQGHVTFGGHVPDPWLGAYLRQSLAFISASLYEGFGMPLFEALCLGKAAIYHEGTAHEEFAAGAALRVDCRQPEALGKAMLRLWSEPELRGDLQRQAKQAADRALSQDLPDRLSLALAGLKNYHPSKK